MVGGAVATSAVLERNLLLTPSRLTQNSRSPRTEESS